MQELKELEFNKGDATDYCKDLYTEYASHIHRHRAMPSIVDGLKTVFRRAILTGSTYAANKLIKSANITGRMMGWHPHGSSYTSLVGVTSYNANVPLFDGDGNYGGNGEVAAAERYTEMCLSDVARAIYCKYMESAYWVPGEIEHDEPEFLPAMLPYALLEGSESMGVGLACKINAVDVYDLIDYIIHYLKYQKFPKEPPRPYVGAVLIDDPDRSISKNLVLKGVGALDLRAIINQESEDTLVIKELPQGCPIEYILKKLHKYIADDSIDYIDETAVETRYVFRAIKINIDVMRSLLEKLTLKTIHYDWKFSLRDKVIYCGIDDLLRHSLSYLKGCFIRQHQKELAKVEQEIQIYACIARIKNTPKLLKDIGQNSPDYMKEKILNMGYSEETAKQVMQKPLSYLTNVSAESQIVKMEVKAQEIRDRIADPAKILIQEYRDLKILLKKKLPNIKKSFYVDELMKETRVSIEHPHIIISQEKGEIYQENFLIIDKDSQAKLYTFKPIQETRLENTQEGSIIITDIKEDDLIVLITNQNKIVVKKLEINGKPRPQMKLYEGEEVINAFKAQLGDVLTYKQGKERKKQKIDVFIKSRISFGTSIGTGNISDIKIESRYLD